MEPPATPTLVSMVSGNDQQGQVGVSLTDAFVVRVTDARGDGMEDVPVFWKVTSGQGGICFDTPHQCHLGAYSLSTDTDGESRVWFRPLGPGASTVTAEVAGVEGSPVTFRIMATETAASTWPWAPDSARVFERASAHSASAASFHGRLLERYVVRDDGTFRLQFSSGFYGFFEYPGTFSLRGPAMGLSFRDDARWHASGTVDRDGCMVVEYNIVMSLSDFEDGMYCSPPETR